MTLSSFNDSVLIIEPGHTEKNYWADLWRYRELLIVLAWRDISVRYKQTVFGIAWAVIRPFLTMVVFTVIFGHIARLPSDGDTPYTLMLWYRFIPGWSICCLPFFILIALSASFGPSLLIASINVKYRDFRYVTPFIVQKSPYVRYCHQDGCMSIITGDVLEHIVKKQQYLYELSFYVGRQHHTQSS